MEANSRKDPRNTSGQGNRDAVKFECPTCKAAVHVGISRLRIGSKVDCAACKTEHALTAEDVPRLLAEHRKRLGKLKSG
jgi:transcription elongation factor Elf1